MPFKGDMRLGGRHDNAAKLNGTSDVPSVPEAGTLLGNARVEYLVAQGGYEVSYNVGGTDYYAPSQTIVIDYRADGIGGQYADWTNKRDAQYKANGTMLSANSYNGETQVTINGTNYISGTYFGDYVHDGSGSYTTANVIYQYYTGGIFNASEPYTMQFNGQTFTVGTRMAYYNHNGNGGYTVSYESPAWYPDYTVVGSSSYSNYFDISGVGTGFLGSTVTDGVRLVMQQLEWEGVPNTSYTSSGTYIGVDEYNTYYYHDGNGSYYTSSVGPNGEGSGGGGSNGYTTYINIGGNDYPNGWYDYGTMSQSYYSYGEYITYYDGYSYYHDGYGSYYTT